MELYVIPSKLLLFTETDLTQPLILTRLSSLAVGASRSVTSDQGNKLTAQDSATPKRRQLSQYKWLCLASWIEYGVWMEYHILSAQRHQITCLLPLSLSHTHKKKPHKTLIHTHTQEWNLHDSGATPLIALAPQSIVLALPSIALDPPSIALPPSSIALALQSIALVPPPTYLFLSLGCFSEENVWSAVLVGYSVISVCCMTAVRRRWLH